MRKFLRRSLPPLDGPLWAAPIPQSALTQARFTAWHEAGHAVANASFGRSIVEITIHPGDSKILGRIRFEDRRLAPSAEAAILLAGMAAELLGDNLSPWAHARRDIQEVVIAANVNVGKFFAMDAIDRCWDAVVEFFEDGGVETLTRDVAAHLILRGTLNRPQMADLIYRHDEPLRRISVCEWGQLSWPIEQPKQTECQRQANLDRLYGYVHEWRRLVGKPDPC